MVKKLRSWRVQTFRRPCHVRSRRDCGRRENTAILSNCRSCWIPSSRKIQSLKLPRKMKKEAPLRRSCKVALNHLSIVDCRRYCGWHQPTQVDRVAEVAFCDRSLKKRAVENNQKEDPITAIDVHCASWLAAARQKLFFTGYFRCWGHCYNQKNKFLSKCEKKKGGRDALVWQLDVEWRRMNRPQTPKSYFYLKTSPNFRETCVVQTLPGRGAFTRAHKNLWVYTAVHAVRSAWPLRFDVIIT